MTPLISFQNLGKSFGTRILFENLSMGIFPQERVGLIGPNGAGKSTLLKILAGLEKEDEGVISFKRGLKVGYVPQTSEFSNETLEKILLNSLKNDERPDYEKEILVETWLSKLGFNDPQVSASKLSGGWKKRLSLAKELMLDPDLLLLDEPTNHLDLDGILWLESFLKKESPTYLLVSHDRYFLQSMTSRVVEINRTFPKGLFAVDGSYKTFLEKKELFLKGQLEEERELKAKARKETDWLNRSPKARTTKAESRISAAEELLENLSDVKERNKIKKAEIGFVATDRETRKLLTATNLGKKAGERILFEHLNFTLSPGTRLGLMGPNGCGKTTLLRLLAGEIKPDQGTIKTADSLKIVYFDQHRNALPDHLSLREALSPHSDFVTFQGCQIHINGWCKRFLFTPELLEMPLNKLSGGERARIAIAHLMLQEADILLLDEPTNDLDIQTLETLEESLLTFGGAIVLITHDRYMLDRVSNTFLGLGKIEDQTLYASYAQWEASLKPLKIEPKESKPTEKPVSKPKLSHSEKKEYEKIESEIQKWEGEIKKLTHLLESPEIATSTEKLDVICKNLSLAENKIEQLYLRWEELDQKK